MNLSIYDRYLDALKIPKSNPSLEALTNIIKAHLRHVPFVKGSGLLLTHFKIKIMPESKARADEKAQSRYGVMSILKGPATHTLGWIYFFDISQIY